VRYYQDRLTRSIYSAYELGKMMDRKEITLQELLVRFEELTADKRRLLEETEKAAARARGEHRPAWFHFWG
jgi:hypothetical protein